MWRGEWRDVKSEWRDVKGCEGGSGGMLRGEWRDVKGGMEGCEGEVERCERGSGEM
jgi:hypothetical protein